MPLLVYVGADSTYAKTWLWKAVRRMIFYNGQVVCINDKTQSWTPLYDGHQYDCQCPVFSKHGFEGIRGSNRWPLRAAHNAWTFQHDVRDIREAIRAGSLDEYMDQRLKGTAYETALQYARELTSGEGVHDPSLESSLD